MTTTLWIILGAALLVGLPFQFVAWRRAYRVWQVGRMIDREARLYGFTRRPVTYRDAVWDRAKYLGSRNQWRGDA